MIRVLQINGGHWNGAGVENVIMNYYRHINRDSVQFEFVSSNNRQKYDREIESLGGVIRRLPSRRHDTFHYLVELYRLMKKEQYDIIHIHTNSASFVIDAIVAKLSGQKTIIAHSHNTDCIRRATHYLLRPFSNSFISHRFACSQEAGRWLFGNKKDVLIVNNAIDTSLYKFNEVTRAQVRKDLGIVNDLVIGFVGRLVDKQKNILRMIDIFSEVCKVDDNAKLLIVGDGEDRSLLEAKIARIGLESKAILLGHKEDVNNYLMAMDVLMMPSFFEGLCMAVIEAQASGLPCVISDTIPVGNLTGNVRKMSLRAMDKEWAEELTARKSIDRINANELVSDGGYDISKEASRLLGVYKGILNRTK